MAKKKAATSTSRKSRTARSKLAATADFSKRILNCLPSSDQQNDWDYSTALSAGLVAAGTIPSSKDLREPAWWEIGDQGQTGSCVGWATADSVLRWHFVKKGSVAKTDLLSPRFTWMASKETDEFSSRPTTFIELDGTSLKAALDVSRNFGSVQDAVLPIASGQLYQGDARTFYAVASQLRVASYINLGRNPQEWRQWIANNGPILTRLDVDQTWMNASSTNGKLAKYMPGTGQGGHAVAIVGYTPTTFIVRNSWGTIWGDAGFAHASNDYALNAFTEAYGVTV